MNTMQTVIVMLEEIDGFEKQIIHDELKVVTLH